MDYCEKIEKIIIEYNITEQNRIQNRIEQNIEKNRIEKNIVEHNRI